MIDNCGMTPVKKSGKRDSLPISFVRFTFVSSEVSFNRVLCLYGEGILCEFSDTWLMWLHVRFFSHFLSLPRSLPSKHFRNSYCTHGAHCEGDYQVITTWL